MIDFCRSLYIQFLKALIDNSYSFYPLCSFTDITKIVILRHDVDRLPQNSLTMSKLENSLGIQGTYYFRIVECSYNREIMEIISGLGHEIGYHYEEMDLAYKMQKMKARKRPYREMDLIDEAYELFCHNLKIMREVADIKTICMHGTPLSPFDNKAIWKKYNYRDLGIIREPYLDMDWDNWAYLTDTGRKWNGDGSIIRDKVDSKFKSTFKSTQDIINRIDQLPNKIMFTLHPQRWTDKVLPWLMELISQNLKNIVKRYIIKRSATDQYRN